MWVTIIGEKRLLYYLSVGLSGDTVYSSLYLNIICQRFVD